MEFSQFIRKPFVVQAIEITEENMEDVAKYIGTVRTKGDVTFIALDRRIVPNVSRAFVGWWLTILGDNYRCYAPKVFNEQFIVHAPATGYFFEEESEPDSPIDIERPSLDAAQTNDEDTASDAEASDVA